MSDDLVRVADVLDCNPPAGWEHRTIRKIVSDCNCQWLQGLETWQTYLTLTFRDPREGDVAERYWRRLVQVLNRDAFGKRYVRKVGHSYFSYVLATEYQRRDVVHFHALTNQPVNFDLVHKWWNAAAGFAWIEPVKSEEQVSRYVTKYCVKGGQLQIFQSESSKVPLIGEQTPMWWPS